MQRHEPSREDALRTPWMCHRVYAGFFQDVVGQDIGRNAKHASSAQEHAGVFLRAQHIPHLVDTRTEEHTGRGMEARRLRPERTDGRGELQYVAADSRVRTIPHLTQQRITQGIQHDPGTRPAGRAAGDQVVLCG